MLNLVRPDPVGVGAEVVEELEHRLDVGDARDVAQRDGLGRQQARSENRQRPVLVSGRPDPPVEGAAALDQRRTRRRAR